MTYYSFLSALISYLHFIYMTFTLHLIISNSSRKERRISTYLESMRGKLENLNSILQSSLEWHYVTSKMYCMLRVECRMAIFIIWCIESTILVMCNSKLIYPTRLHIFQWCIIKTVKNWLLLEDYMEISLIITCIVIQFRRKIGET